MQIVRCLVHGLCIYLGNRLIESLSAHSFVKTHDLLILKDYSLKLLFGFKLSLVVIEFALYLLKLTLQLVSGLLEGVRQASLGKYFQVSLFAVVFVLP